MSIKSFFSRVKTTLQKGWELLQRAGLDDEVMSLAQRYVKTAATKYVDNNERREWVLRVLVDHKVPEGVARVAIELALKLLKQEISDRLDAELAKDRI